MKIISISTDRKIFEEGSAVSERMKEYGTLFEELHVVVFTLRAHAGKKVQLSENVWAYPTESRSRFFYIFNALHVARKILPKSKDLSGWSVSTQDPFETGIVGKMLKQKTGVRLQVQVHTDVYTPYFSGASVLNKVRVFMAPKVLRSADSVRVVSERIKRSLVEKGVSVEKIQILPIFVDRTRFDEFQDVARKGKTVVAVSRLSREKNLFFLIDVFDQLIEEKVDTRLVIVGDGPLRGELEQYVKEKTLERYVTFLGWRNDTSQIYKEASVFVHTSLFEGYGLVFVEAALQHVPIVSSDVGIMGGVFENEKSALICPVGDKKCFVGNIKNVLGDRSLAQKVSDEAHEEVLKHLPANKEEYLLSYKNSI